MSRYAQFFLTVKVMAGLVGTLNLGICTAFLLNKPVTIIQLSIIYSLILGTSFLMEYPTGNLADRFGRKRIYALGLVFTSLQFLGYAAFQEVYLLYLAAILGGAGGALISGSLEAWLITEEKKQDSKTPMNKVFGLYGSLTSIVSIVGSLLIGLLLRGTLYLFYWAGGTLMFLAAIAAVFTFPDNRGRGGKFLDYTLETVKIFFCSPVMIFLGLVLSAAFASYSVFILYWQPQALTYGVAITQLPLLFAFYLVARAISGWIFAKYARKIGARAFLLTAFTLGTVSFSLMTFGSGLVFLAVGLFFFGLGSYAGSVFFDWAADIIPADHRASMLSLISAVASLSAVLATVGTGLLIDVWGLSAAAITGLVFNLFVLIGLVLIKEQTVRWEEARAANAN